VLAALGTRCADAQVALNPGVRIGISPSTSDLWLGGHIETPSFQSFSARITVDFGIGDRTSIASAIQLLYRLPQIDEKWTPVIGFQTGSVVSLGALPNGRSTGGGGIGAVLGLEHRSGMFAEAEKFFVGKRLPAASVSVGYRFH
jgi:hypothetical protein